MRVLVASARAPAEPQNGFTVRVAGMLTALARNHDVRLVAYGRSCSLGGASGVEVSLVDPPDEAGPATRMAARVTAATTGEPALLRSYRKGKLASAVEEAVDAAGDRPDVVHFAGLGAAHVAAHLLRGAPRVLDLVDAWHLEAETSASTALTPASRAAWRRRATMIRRFEARAIQRCDLAIASAWRDVDALRPLAGSVPLAVVGNGVDTGSCGSRCRALASGSSAGGPLQPCSAWPDPGSRSWPTWLTCEQPSWRRRWPSVRSGWALESRTRSWRLPPSACRS